MITKDYLHSLFKYLNGELYWKVDRGPNKVKGKIVGSISKTSKKKVRIYGKNQQIHRLIFMMFNGYMPIEIDHIDNDTSNNKIENLRKATRVENQYNIKKPITNSSGFKNVSWNKQTQKWGVRIQFNKKPKHIGFFDDIELADLVAQEARNKYHGNFAKH